MIRTLTFFLYGILLSLFPLTQLSATPSDLKIVKHKLSTIQSFSGEFQQLYYDALLVKVQKSKGSVEYLKPGLMIWKYQVPEELEIIIGKEKIWIFDPILENVTIQKIDAVARVEMLSFILKQDQLEDHFQVITPEKKYIIETAETKTLYLKPRQEKSHFKEIQIQLDKKRNCVQKFAIIEHNLNYRIITLSHLQYNHITDPSKFEFTIPDGVEIIDGMDN